MGPLIADDRLVECALLASEHPGHTNKTLVPENAIMAAVQEIWPEIDKASAGPLPQCMKIEYPQGIYFEVGKPVAKKASSIAGTKRLSDSEELPTERGVKRSKVSTDRQPTRWAVAIQEPQQLLSGSNAELDTKPTDGSTSLPRCLAYIVANVFLRRGPGGRPSKPAGEEEELQATSKKKSSKRQAPFVRMWLPYA